MTTPTDTDFYASIDQSEPTLRIWYQDPDNFLWNLSDRTMMQAAYPTTPPVPSGTIKPVGGFVCSAIAGIEGLATVMQTIPLLDGTALPLTYLPQTGTIGIAIAVSRPASNSRADYYDLLDKIVRAFYNRRNSIPIPGLLIIQRPGGVAPRQIEVYTTSGLNTPEVGVNNITVYSLALSTPDPYWSGLTDVTMTYNATFDNNGILPVDFTATPPVGIAFNQSSDVGSWMLPNNGDSYTYPNWIITGPGQPVMTNITAGRSWSLSQSIPPGQQVQVTTARGKQSCVNITTGENIWNQLIFAGPHDLWPLMAGPNQVSLVVAGGTDQTKIQVSYRNRFTRA